MKLHSLREHFYTKNNKTWKPKRSFESKEEIEKVLGFKTEDVLVYTCRHCGNLHLKGIHNAA